MEGHGREQARQRAFFPFAQYQAAHGRLGHKLGHPDCAGGFPGRGSSVVSAAIDSESHVYGDGDCGAAAGYSGTAAAAKTSCCGKSEGATAASSGRAAGSQAGRGEVLRSRIEAPKPKPRQVEAELPKVNDTFQPVKLEMASNQPARPREPVKTGMMTRRQFGSANNQASRSTKFRPAGSATPMASPAQATRTSEPISVNLEILRCRRVPDTGMERAARTEREEL